eukprot:NODE_28506_length_475_cov_2.267241.p3 GENE.NODE_28506_length_475_cov_2.267241~~NODE_28506_length_475_cov_2.267241.p3  ORF type:complete len:58 (-),score=14.05 NODE_28506_length_475_cov_2.267241:106-279(-)
MGAAEARTLSTFAWAIAAIQLSDRAPVRGRRAACAQCTHGAAPQGIVNFAWAFASSL